MPAPTATSPVDVVDSADRVVGVAQRGQLLGGGLSFRTAHVLVVDGDRLLLQRLGPQHGWHPGRWGSSAAGHLHAGESYEQGARRRLAEETGLVLDLDPVGVTCVVDGRSTKFVGVFVATWHRPSTPPVLEPGHVADVLWVDVDALLGDLEASSRDDTETFRAVIALCRERGVLPTEAR